MYKRQVIMQAWYLLYCKRGQLQRAQEHLERQAVNCLMPTIALEKMCIRDRVYTLQLNAQLRLGFPAAPLYG